MAGRRTSGSRRTAGIASLRHATPQPASANSIDGFVKERPWGYARQADGSTLEYHVEHPSWDISSVTDPTLDCDIAGVYGAQFVTTLSRPPVSAFIASGSEAVLQAGNRID